jgi:ERCC4-type nuclease
MRSRYTIVVDTREKKPLVFPAFLPSLIDAIQRTHQTVQLGTVRKEMKTADYYVLGFPEAVVIERKGHLDEVAKNVLTSTGRRRFVAELERLKDGVRWPYLLFEGTASTLARPTKRNPSPHIVVDALLDLLLAYNVPMLLLPSGSDTQRRRVGELAARLLVRGAVLTEQ